MRIPSPYRKNPPPKKRRWFGRHEEDDGTGDNRFDMLKNLRGIVAAFAVVAVVGGMCFSRSCRDEKLTEKERYNVACRDLLYMGIALTNFHGSTGRYPTTEEGLNALVQNPGIPGWKGPYLVTPTYNPWCDPWKHMYRYSSSNGTSVVLFTCGADGKPGTGDERVCPQFQPSPADRLDEALRKWKADHPSQEPDAPEKDQAADERE